VHTIGVSGTVDMAIVPVVGLVLDVSGVDSDTASLFFRSLVDFGVADELGTTLAGKDLGDCGGQSGFTVIDVTYVGGWPENVTECTNLHTNSTDIHMGL